MDDPILAHTAMCEGTVVCGEPMLEHIYPEGLHPVERTHTRSGYKCEEEGTAERNCYELTKSPPFLMSAVMLRGHGGV